MNNKKKSKLLVINILGFTSYLHYYNSKTHETKKKEIKLTKLLSNNNW